MEITLSTHVARDPHDVFQHIADYANDTDWREGVLEMRAEGPVRQGTRTFERLVFLGSTYVTEGVVTEVTDRRLSFRGASKDVDSSGYREVSSEGDGALVTYSLVLRPRGFLRWFAPLLRILYARRIKRDLARLGQLLTRAS